MKVAIEYCVMWNYEARAVSLAAEIREHFPDAEVELTPSRGGRFEVISDGTPIFEKSKLKRHAQAGEIVKLLEIQRDATS